MKGRLRSAVAKNAPARRVFIIGGGLAGMTLAKALAEQGVAVFIIEKDERLGGKAGASKAVDLGGAKVGDYIEDHGFHVFPAWYLNTRALMRDLACEGNLTDIHRFHFLRKGEFPQYTTTEEPTSLTAWLHNIFHSILPWDENLLSYFALLDLACEPFSQRTYLDRISGAGFLRSRFYSTDQIAGYHHQTVLQASAIPDFEFSAMTFQKVVRCWLRHPSPLYSVLNCNLQDGFIAPLERRLKARGVQICTGLKVVGLMMRDGHVSGMITEHGPDNYGPYASIIKNPTPDDVFVLATPHEVAWDILRGSKMHLAEIDAADQAGRKLAAAAPEAIDVGADNFGLADLVKLESAPIASLHIHLRGRIDNIPPEHINLVNSRYGITLIDIGQHWDDLDHTALNLNVANFEPLQGLSTPRATEVLVDELLGYFPTITRDNFAAEPYLQSHATQQLFLNTIGAWHFRPSARTDVANLYTAGDYCRTQVDFTTMESAVMSGLTTAGAVWEDLGGIPSIAPLPLDLPPLAALWALRAVAGPLLAPLGIVKWGQRQLQELRDQVWG